MKKMSVPAMLLAAGLLTLLAGLGALSRPDLTVSDALEGRIRATSLGDAVKLKGKQEGFEVPAMDGILQSGTHQQPEL